MEKRYCRYSSAQFKSLGLTDKWNEFTPEFDQEAIYAEIDKLVKGKFANIIDALYSSKDGSLDNDVSKFVSESAPESVRSFVRNVLLCDIQAFDSAPDDDAAFDAIIPRSVQTHSEFEPYMDRFKSIVSDFRSRSKSKTE